MTWELLDDLDDEGSGFCECGVTIGYGETECQVCAGAPHHRECRCGECDAYWAEIERRSRAAAEAWKAGGSA